MFLILVPQEGFAWDYDIENRQWLFGEWSMQHNCVRHPTIFITEEALRDAWNPSELLRMVAIRIGARFDMVRAGSK